MATASADDDDEPDEPLLPGTMVGLFKELPPMVSPGSLQKKRNKSVRRRKKALRANPNLSPADVPNSPYGLWQPSVEAQAMLSELDAIQEKAQERNDAIREKYKPPMDELLKNPKTHLPNTEEALELALLNFAESEERKSSDAGADNRLAFLARKVKSRRSGKRYADTTRIRKLSEAMLSNIERGLAIFDELAGDLAPDGATVIFADPTPEQLKLTGGRSYHDPNLGSIHLTEDSTTRTVLHELGHWLEQNNDQVRNLRKAFQERRSRGKTIQRLDQAYYEPHEKYQAITPMDDYAGRVMDTPEQSEVVTMGLEFLQYDLLRFAKEDAEYLMFMYDVLRVR